MIRPTKKLSYRLETGRQLSSTLVQLGKGSRTRLLDSGLGHSLGVASVTWYHMSFWAVMLTRTQTSRPRPGPRIFFHVP